MRVIVRPLVIAAIVAISSPLAVVASSHGAMAQADQSGQPPQAVKQVALTEKQIQGLLAAKKEIDAVVSKLPEGQSDQPDPKVVAQLDNVAKKYKFANFAEYDEVDGNVGLVMEGIDPQTKKYVGPEVVIKKQIAEIQADKKMSAKDKKDALDQLNAALKGVTPVQFPENIALVTKYYDKLGEVMQQD
ncbi:MAG: hypothetical protein JO273_09040 [Methylobacteriaceae bacterium]|nr:hypothetical protein [Methylobacteriaceae bacterium]